MSESQTLHVQTRSDAQVGSRACKKMRDSGLIPAVVYGGTTDSVAITVPRTEIDRLIRRHETHGMLTLSDNGTPTSAIIKQVQWDVFGDHLIHIDFGRVTAGEVVEVEIPIELRGNSPGVLGGGVLEQPMHTITISCPVESIPEQIEISINEMEIGSAIHVRDLVLPDKCSTSDDPDQLVVQVKEHVEIEDDEDDDLAAGHAEPEVIGRAKDKDGEED